MNQYIITEEMVECVEAWTEKYPVVSKDIVSAIRSRPYNPQAERGLQCETCKHKGTRACMSHGYEDLPKSCSYKLGVDAEEAMRNLNGTHIDVWTLEHDKIVREKVLDNVIGFSKVNSDFINKGQDGYAVVRLVALVQICEELRKGGE